MIEKTEGIKEVARDCIHFAKHLIEKRRWFRETNGSTSVELAIFHFWQIGKRGFLLLSDEN